MLLLSASLKWNVRRWNFSVGQHDVSFVARKSAECDSTTRSQRRERISAHGSRHVDDSCRKFPADGVQYRVILNADDNDEYSDQCQVQCQYLGYFLHSCGKSLYTFFCKSVFNMFLIFPGSRFIFNVYVLF